MTFSRHRLGERAGLGIVEVEHRLARRQQEAGEQLPQLVHLLVVEADVGQHRDLGPVERDRAVALVDLADEQLGVADQRAGERAPTGVTKFFITAPFITVGWRWQAWRIQPIIPVTVDLPLVPPTATLRCACVQQLRRGTRAA